MPALLFEQCLWERREVFARYRERLGVKQIGELLPDRWAEKQEAAGDDIRLRGAAPRSH